MLQYLDANIFPSGVGSENAISSLVRWLPYMKVFLKTTIGNQNTELGLGRSPLKTGSDTQRSSLEMCKAYRNYTETAKGN